MELSGIALSTVEAYEKDAQTTILTVTCSETPLTVYQYALGPVSRRTKQSVFNELHRATEFVHAHIARAYKVWQSKDKLFLLQEKLQGESLGQVSSTQAIDRQYRRKLYFSEPQAWRLLYEMTLAVDYLQRLGMQSSGVSLETVIYHSGRACIEGWHESLIREKSTVDEGCEVSLLRAPEEVYEKKREKKSEVWTLGYLMYRYLTFQNPFGIQQWPSAESLNSLQVAAVPPCYSLKLNNLILRMLYKHPENRPSLPQILSDIPLAIKLRYVKPPVPKELADIVPKPPAAKSPEIIVAESKVLKVPFRRLEVASKESSRTLKDLASERGKYRRITNLRPNTCSPVKKTEAASKTVTADVSLIDHNFFSKTQTRGSSRLSSRDSLNLSCERSVKPPSRSRPTIETLCQF